MGKQRNTIRNKRKIKIANYQNDIIDTKDAKRRISKSFSRELKFTIVSIFVVAIVMISSAFAIFSSIQKSNKYNTLTVGTLKVDFIDTEDGMGNIINLNGAYPESDSEGLKESPYSFKITNSGTLRASYKIKILDDTDVINEDQCGNNLLPKERVRVSINGEAPFTLSTTEGSGYEIKRGAIASGKSENYEIRIWIDENSGNEVLGKHYHGKIVVESVNAKEESKNPNIVSTYAYNVSTCITGEESSCVETTCYQDQSANSCASGTIFKYKVNDDEIKYFYVLHDDGSTITLQQRENTIGNIAWYSDENANSKGPITALQQLESITNDWSNVTEQNYSMGTTIFKENAFTGCSEQGCSNNTYTMDNKIVKARMITMQEAASLGCNVNQNSCPKWMYNYLSESTNYGGSINDSGNKNGYWTMSTYLPDSPGHVWYLDTQARAFHTEVTNPEIGVRAVIVINKKV
ncbi:MAG: hypothetical protein HFJ12_07100 [Bacilli bacterium]|nr:hypothetical protein [Bacilli bacterium]